MDSRGCGTIMLLIGAILAGLILCPLAGRTDPPPGDGYVRATTDPQTDIVVMLIGAFFVAAGVWCLMGWPAAIAGTGPIPGNLPGDQSQGEPQERPRGGYTDERGRWHPDYSTAVMGGPKKARKN